MIAVDTKRSVEFIPEDERDKPEAERTKFTLRVLPVRLRIEMAALAVDLKDAHIEATAGGDGKKITNLRAFGRALNHAFKLCRMGVSGWSNLRGPDGAIIEYADSDDAFDQLETAPVFELAYAVCETNTVTEKQRGN